MNAKLRSVCLLVIMMAGLPTGLLLAEGMDPWSIGYRVELLAAKGEPACGMMGSGAFLRYRISGCYQAEVAFEYVEYDFESPQQYFGSPSPIDSETEERTRLTLVSFRIERAWGALAQTIRPFAFLGLGMGYAAIEDIAGTIDGQAFDIRAEGGIEGVPACGMGVRYHHARWMVDGGVKVEHHLADWSLEDRESGRVVDLADYTVWGGWLGLSVVL